MRDIKLQQVGLELARLLTVTRKFVCFDVTSRVDMDCARSSLCVSGSLAQSGKHRNGNLRVVDSSPTLG